MAKQTKATNAQIIERVEKVYELLVAGARRAKILQYVAEKTDWDVNERMVDDYISRATELIEQDSAKDRPKVLSHALARLDHMYFKSMNVMDFKTALAVQKEINALFGLHAPIKQEVTGADGEALTVNVVYSKPKNASDNG